MVKSEYEHAERALIEQEADGEIGTRTDFALRLFGGIEILVGGERVVLKAKKDRWLLALLALRAGREVERDWLCGVLWPECDETLSRYNLRRALSQLKSMLGNQKDRIRTGAQHALSLDLETPTVVCDVVRFDHLVRQGSVEALDEAITLYGGPLLEDCMEEWALSERRRREQDYVRALETVANSCLANKQWAEALRRIEAVLNIDPLNELLQQKRMSALAGIGDYAALNVAFRDFRIRLHDEVGVEPSQETQVLFQRLRRDAKRETGSTRPLPQEGGRSATSGGVEADSRDGRGEGSSQGNSPYSKSNLPRPLSSLVGREETIEEVRTLLRRNPLVTLIGPGGVGKTRLAIEVAHAVRYEFCGNIWFADLATVTQEENLKPFLLQLFGLKESATRLADEVLIEHLRPVRTLLVLDNCEHLPEQVGIVARCLLEACAELTLLATSRQALGVPGERLCNVACLETPTDDLIAWSQLTHNLDKNVAETLMEYESVRLFVERSRQLQPHVVWNSSSLLDIAQICMALDGLPLAIELAAARTRAMSVAQINSRLTDRFRLLSRRQSAVPARQQTLRALLDWSYDLLSLQERLLLHRLSVFVGGWTLEAAEMVCSEDQVSREIGGAALRTAGQQGIAQEDVCDLLLSLMDKSLIHFEDRDNLPRYRMLETVREYGRALLEESGDLLAMQVRHLHVFEQLTLHYRQLPVVEGNRLIERDYANILGALDFALVTPGQELSAMRLTKGLQAFWDVRGRHNEGRRYLKRIYDTPHIPRETRDWVHILLMYGSAARLANDHETLRRSSEEALFYARKLQIPESEGDALRGLSYMYLFQGNYRKAKELCSEAIDLCQSQGEQFKVHIIFYHFLMADICIRQKEFVEAHAHCHKGLSLGRELDIERAAYEGLHTLGEVYLAEGNYEQARLHIGESLKLFRELEGKGGEAATTHSLAEISRRLGEYDRAIEDYCFALRLSLEIGYDIGILLNIEGLAMLAAEIDVPETAAVLLGWSVPARERMGTVLTPGEAEEQREATASLLKSLGEERYGQMEARGAKLTLLEAVQFALNGFPAR